MIQEQIETILDQQVRPYLHSHGGGIEVLEVSNGTLYARLTGRCSNCPGSYLSTEQLIRDTVTCQIPEIHEVVIHHTVHPELLEQAYAILRRK